MTKENMEENTSKEPKSSSKDSEDNKLIAILAYFVFFLPMITDAKNSKFAMFHANQSLVLLISSIVVFIIVGPIPSLGWFLLGPLGFLLIFILAIIGIINAATGKMKELPIIGGINILNK